MCLLIQQTLISVKIKEKVTYEKKGGRTNVVDHEDLVTICFRITVYRNGKRGEIPLSYVTK